MNRIDRISALLIYLQSRPVVRASEMAERCGVSLRTIYRDMRSLTEAGVPVCGDAGVGYSLVEGYRLPPLMFSRDEALAFLTAEKFIEQLTDSHTSLNFHQGMDKVRAVLRSVDKNFLVGLGNSIEVFRSGRAAKIGFPDLIPTILNSIDRKRAIGITYYTPAKNERTQRQIEPVGMVYSYPQWYLMAWCRLRGEYRNFRLDRIEVIAATESDFSRAHPELQVLTAKIDDQSSLTKVVLRTGTEMARRTSDTGYFMGLVEQTPIDEHTVQQTYMTYSLEAMARWVLGNIDTTTIVEPQELKNRITEILKNSQL